MFANVPISGAYKLCREDIGKVAISKCCLIIDEAAIDYDGKEWKKVGQELNEWLRYFRHAKCDLYLYSQSAEDMLILFRRLCYGWYELHKPIFFVPFFVAFKIRRRVTVNPNTHKIEDLYEEMSPKILKLITAKYCWGPRYFKYFDSYSLKELPTKEWELW